VRYGIFMRWPFSSQTLHPGRDALKTRHRRDRATRQGTAARSSDRRPTLGSTIATAKANAGASGQEQTGAVLDDDCSFAEDSTEQEGALSGHGDVVRHTAEQVG